MYRFSSIGFCSINLQVEVVAERAISVGIPISREMAYADMTLLGARCVWISAIGTPFS